MSSDAAQRGERSRLTPEVRRGQILEAAEALICAEGGLPLPFDALARAAGVSKALVYAYFPNQHALANAVLRRRFAALDEAGLTRAAEIPGLEAAAQACAQIYFDEVASKGSIAHIILRDPFMTGHIEPSLRAQRDQIARRLVRAARRDLRLAPKAAVAALSLMTTIPEEAGRLVHIGDISLARGRELTERLMGASLRALTPDHGLGATS